MAQSQGLNCSLMKVLWSLEPINHIENSKDIKKAIAFKSELSGRNIVSVADLKHCEL